MTLAPSWRSEDSSAAPNGVPHADEVAGVRWNRFASVDVYSSMTQPLAHRTTPGLRGLLLLSAVLLPLGLTAGCTDSLTDACPPGKDIPTPALRSGASSIDATAGVENFCERDYGMMHLDGPLVFRAEPVLLVADGDIVVDVAEDFAVKFRWTGGGFTDDGEGTYTAAQPPVGCHRLSIVVSDPGSDNRGDFAVMVSVGDVDCAEPQPIEGFKLLSMEPTSAAIKDSSAHWVASSKGPASAHQTSCRVAQPAATATP